jgi:alpha-L-rhamnosidase
MIGAAVKRIFRGIILGGMVLITIPARGNGNGLFQSQAGDLVVLGLKADLRHNPIGLTEIPRLGWEISSATRNTMQRAYSIRCAGSREDLIKGKNLTWKPGMVESEQSQFVAYNGPLPASGERVWWQVRIRDNHGRTSSWSEPAYFQMGFRDSSAWEAKWIGPGFHENPETSTPCPFLRKEFEMTEKVKQATVYVTARGLYELHLNGRRVGEDHFTPGWTTYQHRLCYQVYDVTDCLSKGTNAIGAILGDGWYRGFMGWSDEKNFYGEKTALLLQMEITYESGRKETVCTDDSWRSATGPVLSSDILNGEVYDARLELEGWDRAGADVNSWHGVSLYEYPVNNLDGMCGVPVQVIRTLKPVRMFRTPGGDLVFDMGQNMVGHVKIALKGEKGSRIVIHHAEVLDRDGNFYTRNLRGARAEDIYVFKGEGVETYEPRFTFHGFRYIRIREYQGEISEKDITGIVVSSRVEPTGSFTCSDSLVNRLQENIVWGLYGNFLDVPTDCPQRDERMGWTGDAQVFAPTACFNVNAYHFYRKWLVDLALDQREDGSVPWVVPNVLPDGGGTGWSDGYGATGWADAAVIIPWVLYQVYGDVGVLEDQYGSMKAWVEYMIRESGDNLVFSTGFHFGDWLSFAEYYSYYYNAPDYGYAGAHTSKELIATALLLSFDRHPEAGGK